MIPFIVYPLFASLATLVSLKYILKDSSIDITIISIIAAITALTSTYLLRNRDWSKYKTIMSRGAVSGALVTLLSHALFGFFFTSSLILSEIIQERKIDGVFDEILLSMPLLISIFSLFYFYITFPIGIFAGITSEWLKKLRYI